MTEENESNIYEQLTITQLLDLLNDPENTFASDDLSKIIDTLTGIKSEKESLEAKKKRQEEREAKERSEREAQERRAAHVEEVTCMDLPLDWDNIFNSDIRTSEIHADSISDGLVYSLSNLGKVDIEYISSITGEDYKTVIGKFLLIPFFYFIYHFFNMSFIFIKISMPFYLITQI